MQRIQLSALPVLWVASVVSVALMALQFAVCPVLAANEKVAAKKGEQEAAALCLDKKSVVFACKTTDNRLVAVCGTTDNPRMTFHTMTAGKKDTLLSLPRNATDSKSVSVGSMMYAGGGGSYIRFKDGDKDYVIYSGIGKGWEQAGLSILKGEEHLDDPLCLPSGDPFRDFVVERGEKAGYAVEGVESSDFELP